MSAKVMDYEGIKTLLRRAYSVRVRFGPFTNRTGVDVQKAVLRRGRTRTFSARRWSLSLQEGHGVLAEAPICEGAAVRPLLVEHQASLRDPLRGLPEEPGRVEAAGTGFRSLRKARG